MNSTETAQLLTVFSGAYPNQEVTDEVAMLWANVFAGDDAAPVFEAAKEWISSEKFWPTPAGIRERMRWAKHREQMAETTAAIPERTAEPLIGFHDGVRIAYDAYVHQCQRDGKQPREFEAFSGQLARETGQRFHDR